VPATHAHQQDRGRAVQVDPIKPKLKLRRTQRLKLTCDILLSTSAFKFNVRRYKEVKKVPDGEVEPLVSD
jgi:hypothetical protein